MGPLLVIDIQPAYSAGFGRRLTEEVLQEMRQVPANEPIVVVSVNEELSGDNADAIREFWLEQGMDDELFERAVFLEKDYAFFRSWMDLGVPEEEIIAIAREMRRRKVYDSRDLPEDVLADIAPGGADLCDAIFLPYELEIERQYKLPAWRICGGGRGECLREVELWLDSCSISYNRIDHLTY